MKTLIEVEENLIQDLLNTQTQILNLLQKEKPDKDDNYISLEEVVKITGMKYGFLYKKHQDGTLITIKIGRRIRVKRSEVDAFIEKYNDSKNMS